MDAERKRQLKKLGKAEVQRRSAELDAALRESNPAPIGSDEWAENYRVATLRERRLRRDLPVLHRKTLHERFVVIPLDDPGGQGHLGRYLLCQNCGSAVPATVRRRWFFWAGCACGNIRWRCVLFWRRGTVDDPDAAWPVKLIGRG